MTRQFLKRLCFGAAALATCAAAAAHEFWMLADSFVVPPGATVSLSLHVGENFVGERVGLSQPIVAAFRQYSSAGTVDLRGLLPATPVGEYRLGLKKAGSHLLVLDTGPNEIVLPPDKFHAYLRDEGLDFIIKAREAAGTATLPGRERYRRNVKALLQAGPRVDKAHLLRTGQRLEVLPLSSPLQHRRGGALSFQVFFDNRPLAGALVKFWQMKDGQASLVKATSNREGKVTVTPPGPGVSMVSVVHMIPAKNSPGVDWDSFWGNLTFALP